MGGEDPGDLGEPGAATPTLAPPAPPKQVPGTPLGALARSSGFGATGGFLAIRKSKYYPKSPVHAHAPFNSFNIFDAHGYIAHVSSTAVAEELLTGPFRCPSRRGSSV